MKTQTEILAEIERRTKSLVLFDFGIDDLVLALDAETTAGGGKVKMMVEGKSCAPDCDGCGG